MKECRPFDLVQLSVTSRVYPTSTFGQVPSSVSLGELALFQCRQLSDRAGIILSPCMRRISSLDACALYSNRQLAACEFLCSVSEAVRISRNARVWVDATSKYEEFHWTSSFRERYVQESRETTHLYSVRATRNSELERQQAIALDTRSSQLDPSAFPRRTVEELNEVGMRASSAFTAGAPQVSRIINHSVWLQHRKRALAELKVLAESVRAARHGRTAQRQDPLRTLSAANPVCGSWPAISPTSASNPFEDANIRMQCGYALPRLSRFQTHLHAPRSDGPPAEKYYLQSNVLTIDTFGQTD
ncbi:hypothetical protein B0H13DRAFT_1909215 [Mycena leptocephala]|nr:hypothetical protein B0H13DRAFT_1909215 [Mycena leptocephala]